MLTESPEKPLRDMTSTVRNVRVTPLARARHFAWLAIVIADAGLLLWGAMAALAPGCPGACLTTGYETFSKQSWSDFAATSSVTSDFLLLLFRVFGAYNVAFSVVAIALAVTAFRRREPWAWWGLLIGNTMAYGSAMTYDRIVGFIGSFEMLEYVALALVYAALAVSTPFRRLGD
jgi:hypothetical protein